MAALVSRAGGDSGKKAGGDALPTDLQHPHTQDWWEAQQFYNPHIWLLLVFTQEFLTGEDFIDGERIAELLLSSKSSPRQR